MKNLTTLFKALSDPNRLRIIIMLESRYFCLCEISKILNLANSTASKHLSILREAGLVVDFKEGKWVNFQLNPAPSDQRVSAILSSLDFWIADDEIIIADKEKVKTVNRYEVC